MINILITTSTFPRWQNDIMPGFILNLAKSFRSTGCFLKIIAPDTQQSKKKEVMDNISVKRHQYFWPRRWQKLCYGGGIINNIKKNPFLFLQIPFFIISQFFSVYFELISGKYDIINAHWIFPQGFVAVILKYFFKTPVVLTVHGGDIYHQQNVLNEFLTHFVLKRADAVCCVSSAIKKVIEIKFPRIEKDTYIISMGVDESFFSSEKKDEKIKQQFNANPLIIYVGRLTEKKGIEYLIKAFPEVIEKFPETKLLIIGYGVREKMLKELTKKLRMDSSILFLGEKTAEEVSAFLASSDLFIGPSIIAEDGDCEGLPVSFMEAMASGCPVVTTDLSGNFDLIKHNETGIIVPQKNAHAISNAVITLLNNRELRKNIAKNGRKTIENSFSTRKIAYKYYEIFKKLKRPGKKAHERPDNLL